MAILFVKTGEGKASANLSEQEDRRPARRICAYSEAEDEVREMTGRYMAQQYESTLRDSVPQGASVLSQFGRQTDLFFCEKPVFTALSELCNHSHSPPKP